MGIAGYREVSWGIAGHFAVFEQFFTIYAMPVVQAFATKFHGVQAIALCDPRSQKWVSRWDHGSFYNIKRGAHLLSGAVSPYAF